MVALRHLLILALLGGTAFAQQPQPVRLQFPNTDVRDVLAFYERLTQKRILPDNQVQGQVSIVVAGEVPSDEAIRIIEISLLHNGFTLVPVERSNIVKVIGTG